MLVSLALSVLVAAPSPPKGEPMPTDPVLRRHLEGKTVLVLGDSMIVTGLEIWMRQVVRAHGGRMERWARASSTTEEWGSGRLLGRALARHKPDVVLIVLGSNELYLKSPQDRAKHVRSIVAGLGSRPYRWLGPPVWGSQSGIVEVIRTNLPPGRFYPFNGRAIGRHADGRHPSPWGARTWTYDFASWWIARLKME